MSLAVVATVLVLAVSHPASAQCAMCRRALESPEGQQLAAAFRSGIVILLAAPLAVFAIVARLAVRMDRTRRREQEREG
jgi:hypothetical protein